MRLRKLNNQEFKQWTNNHPQITFHQTKEWAKFKEYSGWHAYYVGLEDEHKIVAAACIFAKEIPIIKKRVFYSPRGFLIDYKNKELLNTFTKEITDFIKEKHGIFIKIDPYIMYKQHDINGNLVEGGFDNSKIINHLTAAGYHHLGFNLTQDSLQPRWMHTITVKNQSTDDLMKDMDPKTRQILRKNERLGIKVREISREELPIFKEIMQQTSERKNFIDHPLAYYEHLWDSLYPSGILKILVAEIDFDEEKKTKENEIEKLKNAMNERQTNFENKSVPMNEKKFKQKQENNRQKIEKLNNDIKNIEELKKKNGTKPILGGILFLSYGNEVVSLYEGTKKDFMNFQSSYTLHWEGIKYALKNNYQTYNFYGITGNFKENNPLLGPYLFKKSFGGQVVEFIGEFDLIISKPWYHIYNNILRIKK